MPEEIQAALIGAGAALTVLLVRDLGLKLWEELRKERITSAEVFRRYADPLANAAASLLWRLDEILNREGRGAYLLSASQATSFAQYKRLSTVYRIAALLGWIRAFRRELSFLRTHDEKQLRGLKEAISALEAGLADGAHLEGRRLDSLLDLWAGTFAGTSPNRQPVEVRLERTLKDFLHESGVTIAELLTESQQLAICRKLAGVLGESLGQSPPSDDIVSETRARAIQCLSLREAWLYRDWQAGIGDLMIRDAPEGGRLFEVIGYGPFEKLSVDGETHQQTWIARLAAITDNLDVSKDSRFDARVEQLRNTLHATAQLVQVLADKDAHQRVLLRNTLDLAKNLKDPRAAAKAI